MADTTHVSGSIISGDTYKTTFKHADYNPTDDSCQFLLNGASTLQVTGVANADNDGWDFTASARQTAILLPGTYRYAFRVTTSAGEAYTKEYGTIGVRPNPADTTPKQYFAEKMVAAIERVLEGQLTTDEAVAISSLSIGGRSLTMLDRDELIEERARWIRTLNKLRNGGIGVKSRGVDINSVLGERI